ncbi:MAG: GTP-binding protein [Peptococcaceae bacterium]|nr:GTP-binding protein [Peptococcaceae bacterium]
MTDKRDTLKIVVVGHVDHGKSTLIGRLLYDTESLPEGAIAKVKRICKEKGKSFEYAYLLDAFEEEQKQGITIDTTQIQFFTQQRDYVIIDAPGHKEFLKNMISGAANAEAALLIIDAHEGIQEQSKRHGYILSLLGIKQVDVLVNKMDLIDYSQAKFDQIKAEFNNFLSTLNVHPQQYIPVSAFLGENITTNSAKMAWYTGEPVLRALDMLHKERGLAEKPLRLPIQDVYKFDDRRIIAGRLETGCLSVGDKILISPGGKTTTVKTIEAWVDRDKQAAVEAGQSVGITVTDEFFNQRGEYISRVANPPLQAKLFKASLVWLGKHDLLQNQKYKLKLTTQEVECEIYAIEKVVDAASLDSNANVQRVKINDVAEVIIKTKQVVCFDDFSDNQSTGRFVLVDGYDVSGGGIITGLYTAAKTPAAENTEFADAHKPVAPIARLAATAGKPLVRLEREQRLRQKGRVIWLTGSEEAQFNRAVSLERELFDLEKQAYYLDRQTILDQFLRESTGDDWIAKLADIAKILLDTGLIVILASGTVERDQLEKARAIIGKHDFLEIDAEAAGEVGELTQLTDVAV